MVRVKNISLKINKKVGGYNVNFCSSEQDKTKTISKVFIDEENKNKYTIRYMDNHEETFYDLNDSINDVEELMKEQALERDKLEYVDLHIKN